MRYAGYVRISSEEQVGNYSIEAQSRAIQTWVQAQGGQLVAIYRDEAQSGRTAERPEFQKMRQDARKRQFDALIVHKFDRFARNRTDALAIKSLLRYDYGIKVFSATEPSEDSDGPIGALIEGIMESVAEWYSRNLASEVAKGRKEKHQQGYHNNKAPFGYRRDGKNILIDPHEAAGVLMAFEHYATGNYSYADIANLLNDKNYRLSTGRAFSKDSVRAMLENEVYVGKVKYRGTTYDSSGKRLYTRTAEWIDGQHQPIVSRDLWNACERAAARRTIHQQSTSKYRPYLLRGLLYCHHCTSTVTDEVNFRARGKMYGQTQRNKYPYYKCSSHQNGFPCPEPSTAVRRLDAQVVAILSTLQPPAEWRTHILSTISNILGERSLEDRLQEIRTIIERMDFRWDNGFITDKQDYLEKRVKLQHELERLTPVHEDIEVAADLLANFKARFDACGEDVEAQRELVGLIVERIYVRNQQVYAITLKSDYHVVMGHNGEDTEALDVDMRIHEWSRRELNPRHSV